MGLTRHSQSEKIWAKDLFVNVFRDLPENASLRFYMGLRGKFATFRYIYPVSSSIVLSCFKTFFFFEPMSFLVWQNPFSRHTALNTLVG